MESSPTFPAAVQTYLTQHNFGPLLETESLPGGLTSLVLRLRFASGPSLIFKQSQRVQPGMYRCEADGLSRLAQPGAPRVPEVLSVDEDHILMEDLGVQGERSEAFWGRFGEAMATLHHVRGDRFGYTHSNYLGTMLLDNTWRTDGYAHFGETRMRCFLDKPKLLETLTPVDIERGHRLIDKLPDLIPPQGPSLLHGDLWTGNMIAAEGDAPALIDPAVNFGWPEADLALLYGMERLPDAFFDAYRHHHPLEAGWEERLELLAIRDPLCMIAELGDLHGAVARVQRILDRFVG